MPVKILGLGDPHLQSESDISDTFSEDLSRVVEQRDIDYITSVGDVVDRVPNDRKKGDVGLGRTYFESMSEVGVPIMAVPGNHDYDIHDEITEDIPNVYNLDHELKEFLHHETSISFIGRGAEKFNLYPELDTRSIDRYGELREIDNYESEINRDNFEDDLDILDGEYSFNELEDFYNVDEDYVEDFRDSIETYTGDLNRVRQLFERAEGENKVLVDHMPPFNTDLDKNLGGRHMGSIVDKKIISDYEPALMFCGHLHDGGFEYIGESSTGLVKLGRREIAEVGVEGNQCSNYMRLEDPQN